MAIQPDNPQLLTMKSFSKHRIHVLDGMRGIAAVIVMLYHIIAKFNPNCSLLPTNAFIAVDFFFVLSGYVICHSYGDKILNGMGAGEYISRRVARLFPMMALGLLLGSPALYIIMAENHSVYGGLKEIVVGDLYNIFFIPYLNFDEYPEILAEPPELIFPADSPLWSISFEMLASLLFVRLICSRRASLIKICYLSFSVMVLTSFLHGTPIVDNNVFDIERGWRTMNIWGGLPRVLFGFTLGMIIYQIRQTPSRYGWIKRIKNITPLPDWILYCALTSMLIFPFRFLGLYSVFAVGVISPLLVLYGSKAYATSTVAKSLAEYLGWLSFPLYCLHMPVISWIKALEVSGGLVSTYGVSKTAAAAVIVSIVLAALSAGLIDRLRVQKLLLRWA